MFDLEKSIAGWRRQMLAAGIKSPAPMEELEAHLREEIERQIRSGSGVREAFEISARQIGCPDTLKAEFEKTPGSRAKFERRAAWFAMGAPAAACCFVLAMGTRVLLSAHMGWAYLLPGLVATVVSLASMFGGAFLKRFFPIVAEPQARRRIQFACLLPAATWFCVYAYAVLPNLDYDHFNYQWVMVMTLWTLTLLPVSFRLWKGFDDVALSQPLTTT